MENRCNEISASIVGGMTNALSTGENDIVRDQFKKLHEVLPEIDVFVYDFQAKISFSTNPESIGTSFNDYLGDPAHIRQNEALLKTGASGSLIKKQVNDNYTTGRSCRAGMKNPVIIAMAVQGPSSAVLPFWWTVRKVYYPWKRRETSVFW